MSIKGILFGILVLSVAALVACGGADDEDATEGKEPEAASAVGDVLTEGEAQYVESVRAAYGLFYAKNAAFVELFNQTWNTTGAMFRALREAGAGTAF